ncbi:Uncharacterised protein [[Clostridium] sordellii]|nr:Uncharacterised protein [[Clostridium] sordellii] [Paeniclostridium sordellii]
MTIVLGTLLIVPFVLATCAGVLNEELKEVNEQ